MDFNHKEEIKAGLALPTIVSNRFVVHGTTTGVRISFGEQPFSGSETFMRFAVSISRNDAAELINLLLASF
jgi:hypothetical protein